jgi:hypothetical protein
VTGTAWEHQREALQTIVPGPQLGTAVSRTSEGSGREALGQAPRHPPVRPAPAPRDDSIL